MYSILPGFGLLSDEYATPVLKIWTLHRNEGEGEGYGYAWFDEAKGIKIPLRPFAGEMGVAPGKDGAHSTIPPYKTGGNVDTRHLCAGSTLFLPVEVEGALFSIGVSVGARAGVEERLFRCVTRADGLGSFLQDGHAAQGDGGMSLTTLLSSSSTCADR